MSRAKGIGSQNPIAAQRLLATFERQGNVVVIAFQGEMDFYSIESFRPKFASVQKAGVRQFVFDLQKLQYIDSTGLGFLVGTQRTLGDRDGRLVCVQPSNRGVQKILESSRILPLLRFVPSRQLALAEFTSGESEPGAPADAPGPEPSEPAAQSGAPSA